MADAQPEVGLVDVRRAQERLHGVAVLTPLIACPALGEMLGGPVFVKFEGAQREGSFKFRGAFNRLVQLSADERGSGVVGWSSGNHAQGLASAARRLGIRATIVMPSDAPAVKIANTRELGAEIILYDRASESREEIARALVAQRGSVLVPSFDDPDIIAGQGTVGLELLEQASAQGHAVDQVVVPCGGGGLIAGIGIALTSASQKVELLSAEPKGFDDTARSLASGRRERAEPGARSFCDALLAPEPGELTFPINRRYVSSGLAVSDTEVCSAIAYAYRTMHVVVEPGGAVGLAALLARKVETKGRTTAVVLSGSNIDPTLFAQIVAGTHDDRHFR